MASDYATVKHSVNSETETTIKMNWSSDSIIDYIWYSTDLDTTLTTTKWVGVNVTDGKSGTYTISGLTAGTIYKITTKVRRKDTQKTTISSFLWAETLDYPHCNYAPDFTIGEKVTLKFYNPLNRSFKFYILTPKDGKDVSIGIEYPCSSDTYAGINDPKTSVKCLYDTIPNATSGTYKVKVVYGTHERTKTGGTYKINEKNCCPTFKNFTYKDTNPAVTKVTGSDQIIVKGKSKLAVYITSANKMTALNSATPKKYNVSIDTISKDKDYSDTSDVTVDVGAISSSGTKRLNVRAYDSRLLSTLVYKDITVYDYKEPVINASVTRKNNFENETTLKVSGTYSRLTINDVDKNTITEINYRYRETGGEWSEALPLTTTLNNGKFTCNDVALTLDNQKSFEFEITVKDNLSTPTKTVTVDVGKAILFISSNKRNAYVNGVEIATADNVRQTKYYTQLETGTDLNTIVDFGTYRSVQASDSATMSNVPADINGGFVMYVTTWTAGLTNTAYRRQEIIYARTSYTRHTTNGGETWSSWVTTATLESFYPVGAVYCSSTNTNPSSRFGGTWQLINKGFKSSAEAYTNETTTNATFIFEPYANPEDYTSNVFITSAYVVRNDSTVRVRLCIYTTDTISDTGMTLGTLKFNNIGITNLDIGYFGQSTFSDGANGGIVWNLHYNTGVITQTDIISTSNLKSESEFYIDLSILTRHEKMLDSLCDKFYWKRTA